MTYMYTYAGVRFDLLHPTPEMVRPVDIIWCLSRQARFAGHTIDPGPYTVARHSVYMHTYASNGAKPYALLHDAHEAYIGDIIRPVKMMLSIFKMRMLQENVQRAIHKRFGLTWPTPPLIISEIGELDDRLLAAEIRDLMCLSAVGYEEHEQLEPADPLPDRVMPGNNALHDYDSIRTAFISELFMDE